MSLDELFLRAYKKHSDAIFRYCLYRVRDREHALDVMQDAFTKTWEQLAKGKEIANLKAFLYTVARNLIIDYSRKKKEQSLEQMQEDGFQPQAHLSDPHERIDAREAAQMLDRLDEPYREAVYLRYIAELKPKEIAEMIDETQNVISVRIHRGLQQLKKLLASK